MQAHTTAIFGWSCGNKQTVLVHTFVNKLGGWALRCVMISNRRFGRFHFGSSLRKFVRSGTCEFQCSMVGEHFDRINFIIPDIDDNVRVRDGARSGHPVGFLSEGFKRLLTQGQMYIVQLTNFDSISRDWKLKKTCRQRHLQVQRPQVQALQ
jgi:hypothetical protein